MILAPTGETVLVDAGESARGWDAGRNVIMPFLRERGVRAVDRAVISHGDGDHWGGLAYVPDHMRVKEVVLPAGVPLGPLGELVPGLERKGTIVRWVEAGDTLPPLGELESVVIHPSGRFEELHGSELGDDLNDRSLVLRVAYGDVVFLMTGDVERVAEEWLVAGSRMSEDEPVGLPGEPNSPVPGGSCDGPTGSADFGNVPLGDFRNRAACGGANDSMLCGNRVGCLPGRTCDGRRSHDTCYSAAADGDFNGRMSRTVGKRTAPRHGAPSSVACATPLECTVLKVPHHGSDTSSSAEFVLKASPLLAVVSCGPRERFNLPRPEVLNRYRAQGASLMMTVRDGAVLVRTGGHMVVVTPCLRPSESFELSLPTGAHR